ncbi:MAG TPA: dephospho-CoA kinase [Lentimicrobium sp.]|nr:dephospho-CoA kinase [Lentimicrobium sp.]
MLKVGLTGSIGSGKSTIAKVFSLLGVPVYLSDLEAKKIMQDAALVDQIVERFGDIILTENKIDRKKLASHVFNDGDALKWLNSVIHPKVRWHFLRWVDNHSHFPYIIQESAIMLETGFSSYFDKILVVTCPLEQRINRVLNRDKMTRKELFDRMKHQWPEEKKVEKSDFVIVNDDFSLALPQIVKLHENFISLSLNMKSKVASKK